MYVFGKDLKDLGANLQTWEPRPAGNGRFLLVSFWDEAGGCYAGNGRALGDPPLLRLVAPDQAIAWHLCDSNTLSMTDCQNRNDAG